MKLFDPASLWFHNFFAISEVTAGNLNSKERHMTMHVAFASLMESSDRSSLTVCNSRSRQVEGLPASIRRKSYCPK